MIDAGTIRVNVPKEVDQKGIAGFIDEITLLDVTVDVPAVVVVNERAE